VSLVDSHTHLDDAKFDADREAVIERARAAGVERMVAIGTGKGPPDLEAGVRMADRHDFIYATVGVHPHDASKASEESFANLKELLTHPKVVAMGEIGLDYHYDLSPRDVQRRVFARQLEIAAAAGKPIVIHTREAWDDTMAMVRDFGGAGLSLPEPAAKRSEPNGTARSPVLPFGGILHCFTGDEAQAREALELGFHLAFGGVLTFPNAEPVRQAARIAPEDRLLLETDCPYLAPAPYRGKRNEPAFVVEVARRLAELRGCPIEQIETVTTRNFEQVCLRRTASTL
jgi:TatD DNase family protein